MTNDKKEEKIKNTKRRLLLLILLLSVSIVALTTLTYAWFTSNKRVSVDELQVNVSAVNGLEISANAVDWGVNVNKTMLIEANTSYAANNQLPKILSNVSTAGNVKNGVMDMFYGEVTDINPDICDEEDTTRCYNIAAQDISALRSCDDEETSCANAKFMAFDVYLKLDGTFGDSGVTLYLTPNANVVKAENEGDYGIKNTARIAFIEEGRIDKETYLNGSLESGELIGGDSLIRSKMEGTKSLIWEPNFNAHTDAGIANARKYGLSPEGGKYETKGITKEFSEMKLYDTYSNDEYFAVQPIAMATEDSRTGNIPLGGTANEYKLKVGVTKLRIYFWVEGQDVDTENNAAGYKMSLNLQFAIN